MVRIRVKESLLSSPLKENVPVEKNKRQEITIQVSPNGTVLNTLEHIGISLSRPVVAVINGQSADLGQELKPGDEIYLLPQISGGEQ